MAGIRGLILDIDGTLIDSNDAHARAWVRAFADLGHPVAFETVRPLIGMGADQMVPRASGIEKDTPEFERVSERWKQHFQAELPELRPQPGARALLEALGDRGMQLIAGTSSEAELVEALLKRAGIADLLTRHTTASEVEASKPQPDIVQAALTKLQLPAGEVRMVGDTPFDVQSADKAGVQTIFLRCGGDDRSTGAWGVYDSPQDMLDDLEAALRP